MDEVLLVKKEALRRGLSPRTIETYCCCIERFLKFANKEPICVRKQDLHAFLDVLVERKISGSTLNVYINSIKFFFEKILRRNVSVNIAFSKRPKSLPVVLTKTEIVKVISVIKNPKHKLMIELIYSAGLRVSELTNLKLKDILLEENIGWVRMGKGRKDRPFIIANSLIFRLQVHINNNNLALNDYLFKGRNAQVSTRTIQEILKSATKRAGISKNVHPHTLRHSFATHLVENDSPLTTVQSLLGHSQINTTMVYVHTATPKMLGVESPLDSLDVGIS